MRNNLSFQARLGSPAPAGCAACLSPGAQPPGSAVPKVPLTLNHVMLDMDTGKAMRFRPQRASYGISNMKQD